MLITFWFIKPREMPNFLQVFVRLAPQALLHSNYYLFFCFCFCINIRLVGFSDLFHFASRHLSNRIFMGFEEAFQLISRINIRIECNANHLECCNINSVRLFPHWLWFETEWIALLFQTISLSLSLSLPSLSLC
jgi:hypothetical protein